MRSDTINKPQRPDRGYLDGLISGTVNSRIALVSLSAVIVFLSVILFALMNRPRIVTVINGENGSTTTSVSQKIEEEIIEKQLKYYSKKFCEYYLDLDHVSLIQSREKAVKLMPCGHGGKDREGQCNKIKGGSESD